MRTIYSAAMLRRAARFALRRAAPALVRRARSAVRKLGAAGQSAMDQVDRRIGAAVVAAAPGPLYPAPIETIRDALASLGIARNDSILLHSTLTRFLRATDEPNTLPREGRAYGDMLLDLFLEFSGERGALLLPTEFVGDYQMASFRRECFDLSSAPSNRGFLTELFRARPGVVRSTNPIYNVAIKGPGYHESAAAHWNLPYSMDAGSPWYQFMESGGFIVFFGVSIANNSMIHLPEYVMKGEYPRPVFFQRPHELRVRATDGTVRDVPSMVHAIRWPEDTVPKFCAYLQRKYGIYRHAEVFGVPITVCRARDQYDALMRELQAGVSWYDAMTWTSAAADGP